MSDAFETCCHVWDVDCQTPEDESVPCAVFNINIQATLTTASDEGDSEEDEPCFMEPESVVLEKTEEVRVEQLMNNDDDASSTIRDMLVSLGVPVQDFMVDKILACAHRMLITEQYRNRKVLRMRVEIEAVVDELPDDDEEEEEDHNSIVDNKEDFSKLVRKVVVEGPNTCCAICLEDFLVGTETTSTPCSHVFHDRCILPWLHKKKVCPVCRSHLST